MRSVAAFRLKSRFSHFVNRVCFLLTFAAETRKKDVVMLALDFGRRNADIAQKALAEGKRHVGPSSCLRSKTKNNVSQNLKS